MSKRLFVAIGVHKATTMPRLDGVLASVKTLSDWAVGQGYDVIRIDDTMDRVTVARIKEELTPVKAATGEPDPKRLLDRSRIVVYFCGHGLHAPQDQYWILSAGPKQPNERISAVGFRDVLTTYGPQQIAFISDACRSAQVVLGLASSVVDAYEGQAGVIQKDNFFSSRDGEESFAVPSRDGTPAYCIFSSILTKALSEPADFEALDGLYLKTGRMIVSSQSLAGYLEKKVRRRRSEPASVKCRSAIPASDQRSTTMLTLVPPFPIFKLRGRPGKQRSRAGAKRPRAIESTGRVRNGAGLISRAYSDSLGRFLRTSSIATSEVPYSCRATLVHRMWKHR
jgi:hypothetical protein